MKSTQSMGISQNTSESSEPKEVSTRLPYILWVSGGLVETVALLAGFYWILDNPDSRGLIWRVTAVALLAVMGGGLSLAGVAALAKKTRDKSSSR